MDSADATAKKLARQHKAKSFILSFFKIILSGAIQATVIVIIIEPLYEYAARVGCINEKYPLTLPHCKQSSFLLVYFVQFSSYLWTDDAASFFFYILFIIFLMLSC